MPRARKDTVQIAIRIPREWVRLADHVLKQLDVELEAMNLTRTDVFRMAMSRGLVGLAKESHPRRKRG